MEKERRELLTYVTKYLEETEFKETDKCYIWSCAWQLLTAISQAEDNIYEKNFNNKY